MGIVLGVIGAIVAIGLALILMWKVFTTIHDRREFARFEKERMLAKWDTVRKPMRRKSRANIPPLLIHNFLQLNLLSFLYFFVSKCYPPSYAVSGRKSNFQTSYIDIQKSNICRKMSIMVVNNVNKKISCVSHNMPFTLSSEF